MTNTRQTGGPLTVAHWMRLASTHPDCGYYAVQDSLAGPDCGYDAVQDSLAGGATRGDFITAPAISPLFGQMLAVHMAHELGTRLGSAAARPIRLVELGPGSGALMQTVLHTLQQFEGMSQRIAGSILVERSPRLRAQQRAGLLSRFPSVPVSWAATVDELDGLCRLGDETLLVFSNEFFDALPLHVLYSSAGECWDGELLVDGRDLGDDVHFRFVRSRSPTAASAALPRTSLGLRRPTGPGDLLECSVEAQRTCALLAQLLARTGGMFLAVDYGYGAEGKRAGLAHTSGRDLTLRAIRNHQVLGSPLESVGEADLSADVDFDHLRRCFDADGRFWTGPLTAQGAYLAALGIHERTEALVRGMSAASASPAEIAALRAATARLVEPEQMGLAYRVFSAVTKQ